MEFDMGFALMDRLFPLMFLVVFIFIISTIVGSLVSGAKRKHKNDQSPRVTADAKVVSKRMQVGQNRQSSGDNDMMRSYTYSKYFVTFEFESGDRLELRLPGREYGLLTEGDTGLLTFQGTRYLSFERQGTAVSYQAETSERAENGNLGERRSWDPEL